MDSMISSRKNLRQRPPPNLHRGEHADAHVVVFVMGAGLPQFAIRPVGGFCSLRPVGLVGLVPKRALPIGRCR